MLFSYKNRQTYNGRIIAKFAVMIMTLILTSLLGGLLNSGTAPCEKDLLGTWGYAGNCFVLMDEPQTDEISTPSKSETDAHLKAMGATHGNLVLSFSEGQKANLRLGDNSFDIDWQLNPTTKEFKATVGLFTIRGYLVKKGDRIVLAYTRQNLFMIMRFLCTPAGRKHIAPLGTLLDCTKGLSIAMEFSR